MLLVDQSRGIKMGRNIIHIKQAIHKNIYICCDLYFKKVRSEWFAFSILFISLQACIIRKEQYDGINASCNVWKFATLMSSSILRLWFIGGFMRVSVQFFLQLFGVFSGLVLPLVVENIVMPFSEIGRKQKFQVYFCTKGAITYI